MGLMVRVLRPRIMELPVISDGANNGGAGNGGASNEASSTSDGRDSANSNASNGSSPLSSSTTGKTSKSPEPKPATTNDLDKPRTSIGSLTVFYS